MVIKVYTSGISGNKEVKKRQQRIMMILESKGIEYEAIDITEPGNEDDKQFMQDHAKPKDGAKHPLPPQIFNELEYCGDYDGFDVANENDELEVFLKMPIPPKPIVPVVNGSAPEPEHSTEKDSNSQVPERQDELALSSVTDSAENELEKPSNVNSEENSEAKETESSEENGLNEESNKTEENADDDEEEEEEE
uniref:Uncharacterized protein n=2 Tax=Lygus hesperus TaxID=30085 RepID=A0A0A9VYH5_LYGHE